MTPEEVIDLLTTAAAFDRRTVGEADVIAWQSAVGDLDFPDARDAVVQHYRATRDWIMPSDVRRLVKAIRDARLAREAIPAPDAELSDDARAYLANLKSNISKVASGWDIGRALKAPKGQHPPTPDYLAARGEDPNRELRVAALNVQCPRCHATAGDRCVNADNKPLNTTPAHDARLVEAGLARWVEVRGQRTAELLPEVQA
jgi:hypothetical protein